MTRTPFDQFSKQFLEELLTLVGEVKPTLEVPGEPRFVDIWFAPFPQPITGVQIESYASPTAFVGAFRFDSTNNLVVTTPVPEPATIGGTIVAGLLSVALKKKFTAKKTG